MHFHTACLPIRERILPRSSSGPIVWPRSGAGTRAGSRVDAMTALELKPNRPSLSLHIPAPKCRPGDKPDFSRIKIPAAGAMPRPDIAVHPREITDLAYGVIRVLDEQGRAVGTWNPRLDPETLRRGL